MQVRILGCSGGIGAGLRTTAILVDDDVLIDCGTGVGDLTLAELQRVRHVFLTHSHLDHVACLPFLVDTVFPTLVREPLTVHLLVDTLDALREHVFNWRIWPDFFRLPDERHPVLRAHVLRHGQAVVLDGRSFEAIAVSHTVPAVGYRVEAPSGRAFAFSGDTQVTDEFWRVLNAHPSLDALIMECAFPDREAGLSALAGHHCPASLSRDLLKLRHKPALYISHLMPGKEGQIMSEVGERLGRLAPRALQRGEIFQL